MSAPKACKVCAKTLLAMDPQVSEGGNSYHKTCFKCNVCGGQLTTLNLSTINGTL
jgi:hypothetical protein